MKNTPQTSFSPRSKTLAATIATISAACVCLSPLSGATTYTGASGDWNTSGNWDAGVPDITHSTLVDSGGSPLVVDLSGTAAAALDLTVRGGTSRPNAAVLDVSTNLTVGTSTSHNIYLGVSGGSGILNQTAGIVSVSGSIRLDGDSAGAFGEYNFSGGTLTTARDLGVGTSNGDVGIFNASGSGTITIGRGLNASISAGDSSFSFTGGAVSVNTVDLEIGRGSGGADSDWTFVGTASGFTTINVAALFKRNAGTSNFNLDVAVDYVHVLGTEYTLFDSATTDIIFTGNIGGGGAGGVVTGVFDNFADGDIFSAGGHDFEATVTNRQLMITAIPEPSSAVVLLGAVAGMVALVRRRR